MTAIQDLNIRGVRGFRLGGEGRFHPYADGNVHSREASRQACGRPAPLMWSWSSISGRGYDTWLMPRS